MGADGLLPTVRVYSRLHWFPGHAGRPSRAYWNKTVINVLSEAAQGTCEARINTELGSHLTPYARKRICTRGKVREFLEESRSWEGPITATCIVRKAVWVYDDTKVNSFPPIPVIPSEAQPRDADYTRLLRNVVHDD